MLITSYKTSVEKKTKKKIISVFRGPQLPPMGRPQMPRPSMSTPQMRQPNPGFRYPGLGLGGQTEIRPGVTLQVIINKTPG